MTITEIDLRSFSNCTIGQLQWTIDNLTAMKAKKEAEKKEYQDRLELDALQQSLTSMKFRIQETEKVLDKLNQSYGEKMKEYQAKKNKNLTQMPSYEKKLNQQ